ncbi:cysteine peptidase family C39 domain-containing protein [Pilibacter termitis]|uniref:cysteine peptidase family C39 domain-containing protein n=1 Tax=Pilibacter termitis TaxID=263852 RepID=UPI0022858757|nr:cysteine peptidase family C39 domain-containing protein [Pilibacter termitis]
MIQAARQIGLQGSALSGTFFELKKSCLKEEIKFPFIAHITEDIGWYHFVVVKSINKDCIEIFDPAIGERKIIEEEFIKSWSGNVIVFFDIENTNITNKNRTFFKLSKNQKKLLTIIFLSFFLSLSSMSISFTYKSILDIITGNSTTKWLQLLWENKFSLFAILTVFYLVQGVTLFIRAGLI